MTYAIARTGSLLWLGVSLLLGLPAVFTPGMQGWAVACGGVGVSWMLGLVAVFHRREAWPLVAWETAALVGLGAICAAAG